MRSPFRQPRRFLLAALACFLFLLLPGFASAADSPEFASPTFQLAALTPSPSKSVPPPAAATAATPAGKLSMPAPVLDCPNCTQCANGCQCFGGGYYCADGSCPIGFPAAAAAGEEWVTVCDGNKCYRVKAATANGPPLSSTPSGGCTSCGPTTGTYSGGFTAGACGTSSGGGWWIGKRLGREKPAWRR